MNGLNKDETGSARAQANEVWPAALGRFRLVNKTKFGYSRRRYDHDEHQTDRSRIP
jgi:hypothetical protein